MIRINRSEDCCGCASCVQICPKKCISFNEDDQGFRYPLADVSLCIDCGRCETVCPMLQSRTVRFPQFVYAAKNRDEDIRRVSSSGGIFTLLAERVISEGGVVFGARFDENWAVVHDFTETLEGLSVFRGSKYLQSRIEDNFKIVKSFLLKGRKVLFTGTPCQIAGLKSYLQKDYENLICVDFVCHGVPSPKVWSRYLREVACYNEEKSFLKKLFPNKNIRIESIFFRHKNTGWKNFSFTINFIDPFNKKENSIFTKSSLFSENVYMKAFLKNIILRPSCYECRFREGKSGSDITLGDFWGIDKYRPEFDDDLGVSLVMINTCKGYSCFSTNGLSLIDMTYEEARDGNPSIYQSCKRHAMEKYFYLRFMHTSNFHKLVERCTQYNPDLLYRVFRKFRLVE